MTVTSEPERRQVFISYSHRNKDEAQDVAKTLRQAGLDAWLDQERLQPGDNIADTIKQALENSSAVVVLIGEQPSQSTHYEWSAIVERLWKDPATQVVPVLVGDAEPPGFLRDVQAIRLDPSTGGGDEAVESILDGLKSGDFRPLETPEGRARLTRRLAEMERAAAALDDTIR
jgi:hypothetical protein